MNLPEWPADAERAGAEPGGVAGPGAGLTLSGTDSTGPEIIRIGTDQLTNLFWRLRVLLLFIDHIN